MKNRCDKLCDRGNPWDATCLATWETQVASWALMCTRLATIAVSHRVSVYEVVDVIDLLQVLVVLLVHVVHVVVVMS